MKSNAYSSPCDVCGGSDTRESHWIVGYPRWAHTRCIDWATRPWPYRWILPVLRRAYRSAPVGLRPEIAVFGRWLRQIEREWPAGGAAAVEEASARRARIAARLREAGARAGL